MGSLWEPPLDLSLRGPFPIASGARCWGGMICGCGLFRRVSMSHTYCSALFHCVFSTKDRRTTILPEVQERLWAYMGGIARENGMTALAVGGTDDHAHLLLSLPSTETVAEAMRKIKSGSSLWMHEGCGLMGFEWQKGYGAFSIGCSQVEATVAYIAGQQEHHRKRDFQAEFLEILKRHGIEYDRRYVWG